ncbi:MAG TPA: sulfocyanin-like copper-binding protein [Gemmatimonadales bacterium]|nr:sulfocyanin-like copper-binding protein [Gemmatimonadales bacterium]
MVRLSFSILALGAAAACAAAQTTTSAPAPAPAPAAPVPAAVPPDAGPQTPDWLVADSAARTVTLALRVTPAPEGGAALINGHRSGELQIIVPLDWTVQWDWQSADSTAPHSLVVMAEREKLPTEGGRAAFTNAMTRMLTDGLRPGQGDRTTFTADQAGWYWMLCGVPGHALEGEFIGLRVDPEAKTAGVKIK